MIGEKHGSFQPGETDCKVLLYLCSFPQFHVLRGWMDHLARPYHSKLSMHYKLPNYNL